MTQNDNILPFPNSNPAAEGEIARAAATSAEKASRPSDLGKLAKDLGIKMHASTRTGLKVIDRTTARVGAQEPITDGPAEDERLAAPIWLRLWLWLTGPLRERRQIRSMQLQVLRDMTVLHARLKTLLDQGVAMRETIKHGAQIIAQQQQRAEVRLAQLQKNHEVVRDTLNAHADVIDAQSKAITEIQKNQG